MHEACLSQRGLPQWRLSTSCALGCTVVRPPASLPGTDQPELFPGPHEPATSQGLYSASAGCHPAGSVIGCAGHNAASSVIKDLGLQRWW